MLPSVSATPSWSRRVAILVPRSSSPILVANVTSWPRRARPTATLAGLPPTCSRVEPSGRSTMSISDSPMTSVRMWAPPARGWAALYDPNVGWAVVTTENTGGWPCLAIPPAVSEDGQREYDQRSRHRGRHLPATACRQARFRQPAQHGHIHGRDHGGSAGLGGDGAPGPGGQPTSCRCHLGGQAGAPGDRVGDLPAAAAGRLEGHQCAL